MVGVVSGVNPLAGNPVASLPLASGPLALGGSAFQSTGALYGPAASAAMMMAGSQKGQNFVGGIQSLGATMAQGYLGTTQYAYQKQQQQRQSVKAGMTTVM